MVFYAVLIILSIGCSFCDSFLKIEPIEIHSPLRTLGGVNVKCFYIENANIYSFTNLEKKKNDYYYKDEKNGTYYYNFCRDVKNKCGNHSSSLVYFDQDGECTRLAGSVDGDGDNNNVWKEFSLTYKDDDGKEIVKRGVNLTLASGDDCTSDKKYKIKYQIFCNSKMADDKIILNFSDFNPNRCEQTFVGEANDACMTTGMLALQYFFEKYKIFIGLAVIAIGIFFGTYGTRIFPVTLVLICGIAMAILVTYIAFSNFNITSITTFWLVLLIPFGIGLLIGYFLLKVIKVAIFVCGACCGYAVGIFLYNIAIKYIKWNPNAMYWIVLILSMIVFGLLGLLFYKLMLIVSTSIMGGYLIIKGFSFFCGHFPSESEIIELIKNREYDQLSQIMTYHVYIYLIFWVILSVGGVVFQCHVTRKMTNKSFTGEKDENDKEENFNE